MEINEIEERFRNKKIFKEITGINFDTYLSLIEDYKRKRENKKEIGRPLKISIEDRILLTLLYFKQYATMRYFSFIYSISVSSVYYIISNTIEFFREYNLVNRKIDSEIVIVDATEIKINRPRKNYNTYYSAKKKQFSVKFQVIITNNKKILDIRYTEGINHDFKLFKENYKDLKIEADTIIIGDKGYIGINKIHSKSLTPLKRNSKTNINRKIFNKILGKIRIKIEHVNSYFKNFKILGSTFRNKLSLLPTIFQFYSYIYNIERI